jgi:hypothetical protein
MKKLTCLTIGTAIMFGVALLPTTASARLCFWCKKLPPIVCGPLPLMDAVDDSCMIMPAHEGSGDLIPGKEVTKFIKTHGLTIRGNPKAQNSIYLIRMTPNGSVMAQGSSAKGQKMSTRGAWRYSRGTVMVTLGPENTTSPLKFYSNKNIKPTPSAMAPVENHNSARNRD